MSVLTRATLDSVHCDAPGCDHGPDSGDMLVIGGKCHPGAPVDASYLGGVLQITCAECGALVCRIAVAP